MNKKVHTDSYPINNIKGLDTFGGDEELFKVMLENFEEMTLDSCCERIYQGMQDKNWKEVESGAQQLKGASGYIGAEILSKASETLQNWARKNLVDREQVLNIYLEVMAEAKEVKIELANRNNLSGANLTEYNKYYDEFKKERESVSQPSLKVAPVSTLKKVHTDSYPIDFQRGLDTFGGDEECFKTMLGHYEVLTLDMCCERIYQGMQDKNWKEVESGAHQLMFATGFIGAEELLKACQTLRDSARKNPVDREEVLNNYLEVMAEAKEVKIELAKRNNLPEANLTEINKYYDDFNKERESVSQPSLKVAPVSTLKKVHTESYPIDNQRGLVTSGGDEELFKLMLENFEAMTLDRCCERIYQGMQDKNWKEVESGAHELKGASGYIGAEELLKECQTLRDSARKNPVDREEVLNNYLEVMAEAKEVKIELAKRNNLPGANLTEFNKYYDEFNKERESVSQPSLKVQSGPILEGQTSEGFCISSLWMNLYDSIIKLGTNDKALSLCEMAIKLNPKNDLAWTNKGFALKNLGKYEEALSAYDMAIKINTNNDKAWKNKGSALEDLGKYEEAVFAYDMAIKINPKLDKSWNNKGFALIKLGRFVEALPALETSINLQPKCADSWNHKGTVLKGLKKPKEALEAIETAIKLKADYAAAWINKGEVLEIMGETNLALEAYDAALIRDKELDLARENKNRLLASLKSSEETQPINIVETQE